MARGVRAPDRTGSAVAVAARRMGDRVRRSLFFTPALFIVVSIVGARLLVALDARLDHRDLPEFLLTTVENARTMLGAIVSATITSAVLLFTITLVAVQLASSNFSPRTLPRFLRDRIQQLAIGLVTGTFAYSLVVLREVRAPLAGDPASAIPHIAVGVAVLLTIAALLAIIAAIDHTARSLQVESVLETVMEETITVVRRVLAEDGSAPAGESPAVSPARPTLDAERGEPPVEFPEAPDRVLVVTAKESGWIQQIGNQALREAVEEGATVRVDVAVGTFVVAATPLALVWPMPDDREETLRRVRRAFAVGRERTMQQDIGFGLVRMVDVALRALSPGVNDPNTADEVIVRLGAVLREIMLHDLPPALEHRDDRIVFRARELTHQEYVRQAFDQIRQAARDHPPVLATMVRTLGMVARECERHGAGDRVPVLAEQAKLAIELASQGSAQPADRAVVETAAREAGFA